MKWLSIHTYFSIGNNNKGVIPTKHLCILMPATLLIPYLHQFSAVVLNMPLLKVLFWDEFSGQHQHQSIKKHYN